jgi:hypothetical protein
MTINDIFSISMLIGWAGFVGYIHEVSQGRINRWTTWSEMSNRQWAYCYMIIQFIAALFVMSMYIAFRG